MAKYVIIGGVAAGMTAAARLRRVDEDGEILVLERGPYVSYANCGLPYHIGGVIAERKSLLVQTPEALRRRFQIEVRVLHEVFAIDRVQKKLKVRDLQKKEEYEETYDKLVLCPGGEAVWPPIPGVDHPLVFPLWTLTDTDRLKSYLDKEKPSNAVVVGGGFVGLEIAENLHHRGMQVTVVEALDQVMNTIDFEMAALLHHHLRNQGIELRLGEFVTSIASQGDGLRITLRSGAYLDSSMMVLSVGVRPNTALAKHAGLTIGSNGGITVNSYLQTSDADIYAAGDAIEVYQPLRQKTAPLPLAGPANKQGRIVADNLVFGNRKIYRGAIGTSVVKVFHLTVAAVGLSEKICRAEQIPYHTVVVHPLSHAEYYPGSHRMALKLLFSPVEGKILGAQAVGQAGVDKRIDVISMAIHGGMSVQDLTEMEQAYAPPYSSAKDPVNLAGFSAENALTGRMPVIRWEEARDADRTLYHFLDVRTDAEYGRGHIPGSQNIPLDQLRSRLQEIPSGKKIVVYCQIGLRGYIAGRILLQKGFSEVYNLTGGFLTWRTATETGNG